MEYFAKLIVAAALSACAMGIQAASPPDLEKATPMEVPQALVVMLKYDLSYDAFASSVQMDERIETAPDAWRYLDHGVLGAVQSLENAYRFRADHVYSHAIKGFAARLTASQVQALKNDPAVEMIEPDKRVSINAQTLPWGVDKVEADLSSTRAGDGWGTVFIPNAYVLDTGIDTTHPDLTVYGHVNFSDAPNADCHGHGTHVAGTIGAKDNAIDVVGVAPGIRLFGVKVLNCFGFGTFASVIKGVDWVTATAIRPAVANMSLTGPTSDALDAAIRRSAALGVFYAVAAGNWGDDACNSSPARAGLGVYNGIMTVAATDVNDTEPAFSNYGLCVDIWAPGVDIPSTALGGGTTVFSGTSMSSPHVAGAAALLLNSQPWLWPLTVEFWLKATAVYPGTLSKDGRAISRLNVRYF